MSRIYFFLLFGVIFCSSCEKSNEDEKSVAANIEFNSYVVYTIPEFAYQQNVTNQAVLPDLEFEVSDSDVAVCQKSSTGLIFYGGSKLGETECRVYNRHNPQNEVIIHVYNQTINGYFTEAITAWDKFVTVVADDLDVVEFIRDEIIQTAKMDVGTTYSFDGQKYEEQSMPCRFLMYGEWQKGSYDFDPGKSLTIYHTDETIHYELSPMKGLLKNSYIMFRDLTEYYQKLYPESNVQCVKQCKLLMEGTSMINSKY